MSENQKNHEIINLLSQIIDKGKLENLITNLNRENAEKETRHIPFAQQTANPKKLTALQKKQNRYNMITKKFREKYKNF